MEGLRHQHRAGRFWEVQVGNLPGKQLVGNSPPRKTDAWREKLCSSLF